jgi:hypothetical protein
MALTETREATVKIAIGMSQCHRGFREEIMFSSFWVNDNMSQILAAHPRSWFDKSL